MLHYSFVFHMFHLKRKTKNLNQNVICVRTTVDTVLEERCIKHAYFGNLKKI